MSVPFNNFLTGGFTDADAAIAALAEAVFYRDGSVAMTGTFNAGANSLFAVKDAEFQYSTQVIPPAGSLSLYSKNDDHLYVSTSGGVETQLSSGGDVDGPASAVDSNLCSFDGVSGKIIKDSNIAQADVCLGAAVSVAGNVASFQNGTGKLLADSGVASADLVTSSNWTTDSAITLTDTIGTNQLKQSLLTIDTNGNISLSSTNYLSANRGQAENQFVGQFAGDSVIDPGAESNTGIGWSSLETCTTGAFNTCIGARSGRFLTTGSRNLLLGLQAGANYTSTETDNILLESDGVLGESNTIRIGNNVDHSSCFISGIAGVTPAGTTETVIIDIVTGEIGSTPVADGDVVGPASSTDNAIARFDSTSGKLLQNSVITINDSGDFFTSGLSLLVQSGLNTGLGIDNLKSYTTATDCTAIGRGSLENLTTGDRNTCVGTNTGNGNLAGVDNCYFGFDCAPVATSSLNCGFGVDSFINLATGNRNNAFGARSLQDVVSGDDNCGFGHQSGLNLTGSSNIAIGSSAASSLVASSNTIIIGNSGTLGDSNKIRLGNDTDHTTCHISGINGAAVPSGELKFVVVDSNSQLVADELHLPIGYISGMKLVFNSVSVVDVLAGNCRSDDNKSNLSWTTTQTANIAVSGAGGLMTGQVEAANTTYEIYAIGDSSGTNGDNVLLVPEGVTPAQAGYDRFRYLGAVHNDTSSDFLNFYMTGKGSLRNVWYHETFITMRVLNSGSATVWTLMMGATDSVSDFCPSGSGSVVLNVAFEADVILDGYVAFRPNGDTGDFQDCYRVQTGEAQSLGADAYLQIQVPLIEDGTRDVDYIVNNAGLDVNVAVVGYSLEL